MGGLGRNLHRMFYPKIRWVLLLLVGALCMPQSGFALGPHEILILANGKEPDSIEVAKAYARQRQVPEANIVVLNMPAIAAGQAPVMSP